MTGEDLHLKPSTVEEVRFAYSPLGKIFNRGLKEEDKKERLLKRLKNIEDKSEDQLRANKVSRSAKNESDYNYDTRFAFYRFCRDFERFLKRSIESKYSDMTELHTLLDVFKIHKAASAETEECKKKSYEQCYTTLQ